MKLCFVSENGARETYFVDAPRISGSCHCTLLHCQFESHFNFCCMYIMTELHLVLC
jgi:hypothetical protein